MVQDVLAWTCQYLRWLNAIRKLEEALYYIHSPLRMSDMRQVLEACYLRCLDIRQTLVCLLFARPQKNKTS